MKFTHIIPAILLIMIAGCFTEKKAQKKLDKVMDKYPSLVAALARDSFPCVTTKTDTVKNNIYLETTVTDTTTITDTIKVPCNGKDSVKVKRETRYITTTDKYLRTITLLKTQEDSAKVKIASDAVADKNTEIAALKNKLSNKNTLLWVLIGISGVLALIVFFTIKKLIKK